MAPKLRRNFFRASFLHISGAIFSACLLHLSPPAPDLNFRVGGRAPRFAAFRASVARASRRRAARRSWSPHSFGDATTDIGLPSSGEEDFSDDPHVFYDARRGAASSADFFVGEKHWHEAAHGPGVASDVPWGSERGVGPGQCHWRGLGCWHGRGRTGGGHMLVERFLVRRAPAISAVNRWGVALAVAVSSRGRLTVSPGQNPPCRARVVRVGRASPGRALRLVASQLGGGRACGVGVLPALAWLVFQRAWPQELPQQVEGIPRISGGLAQRQ